MESSRGSDCANRLVDQYEDQGHDEEDPDHVKKSIVLLFGRFVGKSLGQTDGNIPNGLEGIDDQDPGYVEQQMHQGHRHGLGRARQ